MCRQQTVACVFGGQQVCASFKVHCTYQPRPAPGGMHDQFAFESSGSCTSSMV